MAVEVDAPDVPTEVARLAAFYRRTAFRAKRNPEAALRACEIGLFADGLFPRLPTREHVRNASEIVRELPPRM